MATGRVEQSNHNLLNKTFIFIEGICNNDCNNENIIALWQVQKIRHRDEHRNYRYELKFSVTPLRFFDGTGLYKKNDIVNIQSFIQRDDDYPRKFVELQNRDTSVFMKRFENITAQSDHRKSINMQTPIGQPTFIHALFQPPPPTPHPASLNMGEYIRPFSIQLNPPKTKDELYPHILRKLIGNYVPTTFRPNYIRNYATVATSQPEQSQPGFLVEKVQPPMIAHHFHHHFYVGGQNENLLGSSEEQISTQVTPSSYDLNTSSPQKFVFPTTITESDDILEQEVHVTPSTSTEVKPFNNPNYGYHTWLDYPSSESEQYKEKWISPKPFLQSERMNNVIRYSEPDPLYPNVESQDLIYQYNNTPNPQLENLLIQKNEEQNYDRNRDKPDSIEAQLPPPDKNQETRIPYVNEGDISEGAYSQSTNGKNKYTENDRTLFSTTDVPTSTNISKANNVSLRSSSRYRSSSTKIISSTTEQPVLKWKPRKRNNSKVNIENGKLKVTTKREDTSNKIQTSKMNEDKLDETTNFLPTISPEVKTTDNSFALNTTKKYEVLTQKSVSKSVSIKVGKDGEEFPIFVEDENEDH